MSHRSLASLLTLLLAPAASATDWTVTPGASIQSAINAASDGDRILIHPGTYAERIDLQSKRLVVLGLAGPANTILDAAGLGNAVVSARAIPGSGARLEGLTLRNGAGKPFPSSYGFDYYGGGVFADGGTKLLVRNCVIASNGIGTGTFAGGVYAGGTGTEVDCELCIVRNNHAWASGGASLADYAAITRFRKCTIVGNTSNNFFGIQGGVSMANDGDSVVEDSILWGNAGSQVGSFGYPYDWGTTAAVAYSLVQGGFAGAGNLNADPLFANPGQGDYSLLPGSPAIDAGNPSSPLDPDGTRADLGARPSGPACLPPTVYCAGKTDSAGCVPTLSASGTPSFSGADNFVVSAGNLLNGKYGLLVWSTQSAALPFAGGTLCVQPPYTRGVMQESGGSATGADCSGSFSLQLSHAMFLQSGLLAGETLHVQYLYRDPGFPIGENIGLSPALRFSICP
jgi:hypothetical protein